MALLRLDKILASSGRYTRSEAKNLIRSGRVTVNGCIARSGDEKYEPSASVIVDGERLAIEKYRYFMLYKPSGILSATEDASQQTVLDLFPPELRRQGLFPIGRLDKDTTGLLLLTNDGAMAHNILSPRKHIPKRYRATVEGKLEESDVRAFREGILLKDGTKCLPALLTPVGASVCLVTVYEGKYHQIKRMLAARGKMVTALHREAIGSLALDENLNPGQWRELEPEELSALVQPDSCENDGGLSSLFSTLQI